MNLFLLHGGVLTGLILCKSYAGNHSTCEFNSIMTLSCLGDIISQKFSLAFGSYNLSVSFSPTFSESLESGVRVGHNIDVQFMAEHS